MSKNSLTAGEILNGGTKSLSNGSKKPEPIKFHKSKRLEADVVPTSCIFLKAFAEEMEELRPTSSLSTRASSSTTPDSITDELTRVSSPKSVQISLTT